MFVPSSTARGPTGQGTGTSAVPPLDDAPGDAVLDALPVEVLGTGPVAAQLRDFVEAVLGWQVTTGPHLPAVVRLLVVEFTDDVHVSARSTPSDRDGLPVVVVVTEVVPPERAAALASGRAGVVVWPDDHDLLADVVGSAVAERPQPTPATARVAPADRGSPDGPEDQVLRVGAASGGVGATTLAIAIGAQRVWTRGTRSTLVVVDGPAPVPDVPVVDPEVMAGHRASAAGTAVAGVHGLRVAATIGLTATPGRGSLDVVWDLGVVDPAVVEVDVLVARRDRAGIQTIADSACGTVALMDDGPVSMHHVRTVVEGRRLVVVPWSVRVARANALQRVPTSLPGRWLQSVLPLAT